MDDVGEITPHLQLGDVEGLVQQLKRDMRFSMTSPHHDESPLLSFRDESGVEVTPQLHPRAGALGERGSTSHCSMHWH